MSEFGRILMNYELVMSSKGREVKHGRPGSDVARELLGIIHPKRIRRVLDEIYAIDYEACTYLRLAKPDALFAWIQSQMVTAIWAGSTPGCVTKGEFLSLLGMMVPQVVAIRTMPHEPRLAGIEYLCSKDMGQECVGALDELCDFWRPWTDFDRSLMKAAFCTPFWGGRPGARPAISIESDGADDGRGVGKSQLMYAIANLGGGHIDCHLKEDMAVIKKRLLTESTKVSVVAFDNCKSSRISCAEIEGLITAPTVSGWKPFSGNGEISNYLTYIFTMNDASFSADMSSRSVRIFLSRQVSDSGWQDRLDSFIDKNRDDIVNDCIFYLRQPSVAQSDYFRFAAWQRDVLSKIDGVSDLAKALKSRQVDVDADASSAEDLAGVLMHRISGHWRPKSPDGKFYFDPEVDVVLISRALVCDWVRARYDKSASDRAITVLLKRSRIPNLFDRYQEKEIKLHGSHYWLWVGAPATDGQLPTIEAAWRLRSADVREPAINYEFSKPAPAVRLVPPPLDPLISGKMRL